MAALHTFPAALVVPAEAAAWSPQSRLLGSYKETADAWRVDRRTADSKQNGAFPQLSRAAQDAQSNTLRRMAFPLVLSVRTCWKNSAPVFRPRRKSPVECLRWNSSAKRNSELRRQEDFVPRELPAAAACLDFRRAARGWRFGVEKDVRPVTLCGRPTAVAVSRRPKSRTPGHRLPPPNRPARSPGRE